MTWRPGELLRRTAERICSERTMERLLLPILADLQAEYLDAWAWGRWHATTVVLQSYVAFWQALAIHLAMTSLRHLQYNALATPADQAVARRILVRTLGSLVVLTLLLGIQPTRLLCGPLGREGTVLTLATTLRAVVLMLPSILAVTIPMSLCFGVLLALTGSTWPPLRVILTFATLAGLLNFAGLAWIVPPANQRYRETILNALQGHEGERWAVVPKGDRELTLPELSHTIRDLREEERAGNAGHFELEWQKRFAIPVACVTLAFLAGSIVVRTPAAAIMLSVMIVFLSYGLLRINEQSAGQGAVSPVVAMWSGNVALGMIGGLLLLKRSLSGRSRPAPRSGSGSTLGQVSAGT